MFEGKEKKEAKRQAEAEARAKFQAREEEAARKEAERLAAAKAKRQADIEEHVSGRMSQIRALVESGTTAYLYDQRYLAVDAQMNVLGPADGLDLGQLSDLGLSGWEVISVVPRTYGGFKAYKVSKTTAYGMSSFGKDTHEVGLGGHVIGVYVLLQYPITVQNFATSEDTVRKLLLQLLPDRLRAPVK